ncbi:hypothetical protein SGLAM104S_05114 [Streptomyces glaucescens]
MLRGDEVGALLAAHLVSSRSPGHLRRVDRLLLPPRPHRGEGGPPLRGDPDGLQVDRPRRRPALRLRRGPRLLRRPGGRPRQGRHHRGPADHGTRLGPQGAGPHPARPPRRPRRGARPARHRPALGPRAGPVPHRGRHAPAARAAARARLAGLPVTNAEDLTRGAGPAPAHGRPALHPRRCPRHRPSERHGARAEALPGGRRPGGRPRQASRPPAPRPHSCCRRSSRTCPRRRASDTAGATGNPRAPRGTRFASHRRAVSRRGRPGEPPPAPSGLPPSPSSTPRSTAPATAGATISLRPPAR